MYERTMFDKRVGELTGNNIVKGEKEFKSRFFDVREVITADPFVQEFLDWSGEAGEECLGGIGKDFAAIHCSFF